MDTFISSVEDINGEIEKLGDSYIIKNKVANKQLLVYYLYRIFCKYIDLFRLNAVETNVESILKLLKIQPSFNKCAPLVNRLPNNSKSLNVVYVKLVEIFKEIGVNIANLNTQDNPKQADYFRDFLALHTSKEEIKKKLVILGSLVPELSKLKHKPSDKL